MVTYNGKKFYLEPSGAWSADWPVVGVSALHPGEARGWVVPTLRAFDVASLALLKSFPQSSRLVALVVNLFLQISAIAINKQFKNQNTINYDFISCFTKQ